MMPRLGHVERGLDREFRCGFLVGCYLIQLHECPSWAISTICLITSASTSIAGLTSQAIAGLCYLRYQVRMSVVVSTREGVSIDARQFGVTFRD
jgi:hypothetical protein